MRILITRPAEDAQPLAQDLIARGHAVAIEPMLEIAPTEGVHAPLELAGVQAIVFTSANGVRAFAALSERRDLPVFAVGEASAGSARAAGFARVESAAGDVGDLAALVAAKLDPADGALFHGAARSVAGDLQGALESAGFRVRREVLYDARAVGALSEAARTAIKRGEIDAAVFFSPRTARTFVSLVQGEGLAAHCVSLDAICLSAAVSEPVRVLSWRSVRVAARPNQDALIACIDAMAGAGPAAAEDKMPAQDPPEDHPGPGAQDPGAPDAPETAAHDIIVRFGGIRPMANKLGVAVSTVQGWRERGSIPAARHHQIAAAAEAHGIAIDPGVLAASGHGPDGQAAAEPEAAPGEMAARPTATSALPRSGTRGRTKAETPGHAPGHAPGRASGGASWTGAFLIAALVFIVGAGAAVLTREAWMPYLAAARQEPPQEPLREDPNAARIDALERRLAELESRPAADPGEMALTQARAEIASLRGEMSGDMASLGARLDSIGEVARASGDSEQLGAALAKLDARDAEIESALKGAISDLKGDMNALRAELAALAEARAPAPVSDSALALAVLQMRDALRGAEPFAAALDTLEAVAPDSEGEAGATLRAAIAALRPHAAQGAPSLESLRAAFPAVARAAIAQSHGGAGDGMLANAIRRLSALVSVRQLGPVEGASAEAIVARAEAQLEAGDLASALRELDALSGPPAEAAAPWRANAEARLAAQAALQRLGGLLRAGHRADQG